jgi:ABC-type multidrug transport system fused ATPase/permease subunit
LFPDKPGRPKDILYASVMEFFYAMLIIALINLVFATYRHVNSEKMANLVVYNLRKSLYEHFMRQDLGFYDNRANASSVLISTMAEQTQKVQEIFQNLTEFVNLIIMFLVLIIGSFVLEPYFGIAVVIILPLVMVMQYL